MRLSVLAAAALFLAAPAGAAPVLLTGSGICHCPGGSSYGRITKGTPFPDLQSCLAQGAREPRRGQGDCAAASMSTGMVAPAAASTGPAYRRTDYGDGWGDEDGDCQDTRAEVLAALSTGPVHMRRGNCSVDRGRWVDPYTGNVLTDASEVDIDHVVPLAWAHAHGAAQWDSARRHAFANWTPNLMPVTASVNRQKGADGPLHWLPPRIEYRCEYVLRFERIARSWDLRFTPGEAVGIEEIKAHYCPAG